MLERLKKAYGVLTGEIETEAPKRGTIGFKEKTDSEKKMAQIVSREDELKDFPDEIV